MAGLSTQLAEYSRAHPTRTLEHDGLTWRYRVAGEGKHGVLLFPGAVGDGDVYFTIVPTLSKTHRVVSFAYADAMSINQLVEGIRAVVDREGLTTVDIIGGSFGGLVAQVLLQSSPGLVKRVVLSGTGAAKRTRARTNARAARIIGAIPLGITRALLKLIVWVATRHAAVERQFWRAHYYDEIAKISKPSLKCRYVLGAEFDLSGPVSAEDVKAWTGEMLILYGDGDPIAHSRARDSLNAIYPRSRRHIFAGTGHGIALERPDEWARVVAEFLQKG